MALGLVGSCGSSDDRPYGALSPEAVQYVIPDSQDWGSGKLCPDGGACSGAITVDTIERYDWFRITDLAVEGDGPGGRSVQVRLSVADGGQVEVKAWGPDVDDVDDVEDVLAGGYELWAGVDPENAYVAVFSAFDPDGRLAGVGHAAAAYFTVPVAELAAEANAASGFKFLDPLMSR